MLLPQARTISSGDLVGLYDWPEPAWVRACMVMTLDGSVTGPDGLSGSISSPTDRAVFSAVRSLADAYLVGSQTVRVEGYRPVRARPAAQAERRRRGQRAAPTLAIVTGTCRFDWASVRFPESDEPPILLTVESCDPGARADAAAHGCQVVVVGEDRVDVARAIGALGGRGLTRVACEGGPDLLRQLVRGGLLDEVDLTLSPTLVAAPARGSLGPAVLTRMRLHQLVEDDGYLFGRYVRDRVE
ncbi:MAG: pyrimidine reductase family protein [Candidatus Nanopelagicales bacterium]